MLGLGGVRVKIHVLRTRMLLVLALHSGSLVCEGMV